MPRQPIALGSSEGRSKPLNAARLLNLYSEPAPVNSRAPGYKSGKGHINGPFYGTPGQKAFIASLGSGIRSGRLALGYLYVLSGIQLYRCDQMGNSTLCTGDAISSLGASMMTDNGIQLTVLAGGLSYVVVGTVVGQITSSSYPEAGVSSIDTIDGYTIFASAAGAEVVYGPAGTITNITVADPAVVTEVAHGRADNDQVLISGVAGMTQVNARSFSILVVDADTYQLIGIDSTGYSGYTSNGQAQKIIASANGQFFASALRDSAAIDPLDFASAESSPDPLVRVFVLNREILLFGTTTIEPWQDTGASPFQFERVSGAIIERGCIAPLSVAEAASVVAWLGDDKIVYAMQGYQPARISTFPIEEILRAASDVSDAEGMSYSQGGHTFYVLTLPTAGRTLVYDATTQLWHERQSGTTLTPAAWSVNCIVPAWGKILVGTADGAVSELDLDTYSDLGQPIRSAATTPPFYPDGKRAVMTVAELECELGIGLNTGQGSDPAVMLRWSDDGGASWSNERRAGLGRSGNRIDRAIVRRLGMFRQRQLEWSISDPVKRCFYGMRYEAIGATS